jgi:hypothetical protein
MWARLFGPSVYTTDIQYPQEEEAQEEKEQDAQIVYLVDGLNRLPIPLDETARKDFRTMRQWVFETLARLPLEENVEDYTFKVLPDQYIYWYHNPTDEAYGILVKYNPAGCCFEGVTSNPSEELPPIPPPRTRAKVQGIVEVDISDNNSTSKPKRTTNKRTRK